MPRRRDRPGDLSDGQLRWICDPLTRRFDPFPFESKAKAHRMAQAAAERVRRYWREEYGGSTELPYWIVNYIGE